MELELLKAKKLDELRQIAAALHLHGYQKLRKAELLALLVKMHEDAEKQEAEKQEADGAGPAAAAAMPPAAPDEAAPAVSEPKTPAAEEGEKSVPASEESEAAAPAVEESEAAVPASEESEAAVPAVEEADEKKFPEKIVRKSVSGKEITLSAGRVEKTGILELVEGGFGFLRFDNFLTSDEDIYVSPVQIRRFNLKTGDEINCIAAKPREGERFGKLLYVNTVNGDLPGVAMRRKDFSDLTPIYPEERIALEKGSRERSMRLVDLVAPIGKGQRGLIVAPPKAGKTTLLKQIATSMEAQDAKVELIVLLIDERPEEVTDMQRSIRGKVIYSTFDEQPSHHVKVAEMVMAHAQRLCEHGKDVVILLDSITRLARAYNLVETPSGRTLSGGLDPAALYKPKKFFGVARNTEEGGSVTILATALVETGSRMDDVIFEEFKGTGNMELHLDRKLSEKRVFPAINLNKSGTRREDMLMSPEELESVWLMRRALADLGAQEATENIIFALSRTKSNEEFIQYYKKITHV